VKASPLCYLRFSGLSSDASSLTTATRNLNKEKPSPLNHNLRQHKQNHSPIHHLSLQKNK
jgi:hypothetical protein